MTKTLMANGSVQWRVIAVLIVIGLISGCAKTREQIPVYQSMPSVQILQILNARSAGIKSIAGQGTLRLSGADGQSVILDTAIVLKPSDNLARIRAWKFGQAVFDLTVTREGVFVVAPRDSAQREQILKAGSNASQMIKEWLGLISGQIDSENIDEQADRLVVSQPKEDGVKLLITIERRTITPRVYRLLDNRGVQHFSLALSNYVESNGNIWPRRIEAISPEGTIRVMLGDVEINGEIAPSAFQPPTRAEKLP